MRAVLFDVDGTLWDSVPVIREAWNRVFAGNPLCGGLQLTLEATYRLMGHTLPEIAELTGDNLNTVKSKYYRALRKMADMKGLL